MKIAIVAPKATADTILHERHRSELLRLGELSQNDTEVADASVVQSLAAGAEIVVTSWGCPRFDSELLDSLDDLQLVVHAAGSVKGIVSNPFFERGIRISSGNGPLGKGVAETALGMIIASLKNMWRMSADTARGGWWDERPRVRELYDVTVGVVGAGKAGRHLIHLLQSFDVQVLVYDPLLTESEAAALGATKVSLQTLVTESDVVSIHAPGIPETVHLIDRRALETMKDDAVLINTAHGSIVDQSALLDELRSGRLFACLDVTEPEPLEAQHPLRMLPNCVITGHIAGAVTNGRYRLGDFAVAEIQSYLEGSPLTGEVAPNRLKELA